MLWTHIHFPSAAGEVEQQRDFELTEGLQVLCETLSWELLQGILVPLGGFFHLSFLDQQDSLTFEFVHNIIKYIFTV